MSTIVTATPTTPAYVMDDDKHNRGFDHGISVKDAVSASNYNTARQLDGVVAVINQRAFDTAIAVEKTAAAGILAVEKTAAATALSVVSFEGRSALLASQNAAVAAAQLAACCCELKERINEQGDVTRELIRENELHKVRAQLTQANLELALHAHPSPRL